MAPRRDASDPPLTLRRPAAARCRCPWQEPRANRCRPGARSVRRPDPARCWSACIRSPGPGAGRRTPGSPTPRSPAATWWPVRSGATPARAGRCRADSRPRRRRHRVHRRPRRSLEDHALHRPQRRVRRRILRRGGDGPGAVLHDAVALRRRGRLRGHEPHPDVRRRRRRPTCSRCTARPTRSHHRPGSEVVFAPPLGLRSTPSWPPTPPGPDATPLQIAFTPAAHVAGRTFSGCDGVTGSQYWKMVGAGHTWAGAEAVPFDLIVGPTLQTFSATDDGAGLLRRCLSEPALARSARGGLGSGRHGCRGPLPRSWFPRWTAVGPGGHPRRHHHSPPRRRCRTP